MGERGLGVDPAEAETLELKGLEDGGCGAHREGARAEVVVKAGKGEVGGTGSAADRVGSFEELDREAGAREHGGGGEAVGSGSDDHGACCHVASLTATDAEGTSGDAAEGWARSVRTRSMVSR